jgi:hypothetical protein
MDARKIDELALRLSNKAMELLVALAPHDLASSSREALATVCAAMRTAAPEAVKRFLDEAQDAPWAVEHAFSAAALEIARAGIAAHKQKAVGRLGPTQTRPSKTPADAPRRAQTSPDTPRPDQTSADAPAQARLSQARPAPSRQRPCNA